MIKENEDTKILEADQKILEQISGGDAADPADAGDEWGTYEGSFSAKDLGMPTLKIVHGVGKLTQAFNAGDLVLEGSTGAFRLSSKGTPIRFILMKASEYYKQWTTEEEFNSGVKPTIFKTREEVIANGGTTEWVNDVKPSHSLALAAQILVEEPQGFDQPGCDFFGIQLANGKNYAPAKFYIDKTGFKPFKEGIARALAMHLKGKTLIHGIFALKLSVQATPAAAGRPPRTKVVPMTNLVDTNNAEMIASIKDAFSMRAPQALGAGNAQKQLSA